MKLSVREMEERDVELIVNYFADSSSTYLLGMGADPDKIPSKGLWSKSIKSQLYNSYAKKETYNIIWVKDDLPIGHSNINKIHYGEDAFMHLHIWDLQNRNQGLGLIFLRATIPNYFAKFQLKKLICEPYSFNAAPIKTLTKLGFELEKEYTTTPGSICFIQKVKRYNLTHLKWELISQNF